MGKDTLRVIGGFCLLIPGFLLILVLPELGVPLALFGTRLLGDRYKWAKALNARIDRAWAKVKVWFKSKRRN
jgi:hypothetical protein